MKIGNKRIREIHRSGTSEEITETKYMKMMHDYEGEEDTEYTGEVPNVNLMIEEEDPNEVNNHNQQM